MRFFYAPEIFSTHWLEGDEAKHVARVLRARVGDTVALTNGRGSIYNGAIASMDKRRCMLTTDLIESVPLPSPALTLVVAPTKSTDRFEWLLEKATELGISQIQPVWTERSERKQGKSERWNRILIAALKQSQQAWLPELHDPVDWREWVASCDLEAGFMAHCADGEKMPLIRAISPGKSCWIAIGPEGDFSEAEIDHARKLGVREVSLGPNRLRTETAGIAAVHTFQLAQLGTSEA